LKWGPKKLICELEDLLIKFLKNNGIKGERVLGAPGIYVDGKKIASIGLKIKKGFCYHGISLNVDLDLMPFDNIVTCGIDSLEVTQMKNFLDISIDKVKLDLINLLKDQHHKAA
jgi:lipoyl(octanoyl) transferase